MRSTCLINPTAVLHPLPPHKVALGCPRLAALVAPYPPVSTRNVVPYPCVLVAGSGTTGRSLPREVGVGEQANGTTEQERGSVLVVKNAP
eukprot:2436757-Rhodomonas_salina.2